MAAVGDRSVLGQEVGGGGQLAGINEVIATDDNGGTYSGFVQLSSEALTIDSIMEVEAVPEPSAWMEIVLGLGLAAAWRWRVSQRPR